MGFKHPKKSLRSTGTCSKCPMPATGARTKTPYPSAPGRPASLSVLPPDSLTGATMGPTNVSLSRTQRNDRAKSQSGEDATPPGVAERQSWEKDTCCFISELRVQSHIPVGPIALSNPRKALFQMSVHQRSCASRCLLSPLMQPSQQ